ncbi:MAG TPA: prenyltransferase/squalene oxidase repeat-containing protein [Actinocrinis sp.]|nr:prenyltransferase/squalene oxidase repeat-containing protein [Actinocrinis sp.]
MTRADLAAPGVLSQEELAATVAGILAVQRPDGSIPWFHGDKLDPWDHVETAMALDAAEQHTAAGRAYRWLAGRQNPDGSWFANYADGPAGAGGPTDPTRDANFSAYVGVGAYHHYLSTGDRDTAEELWPCVERAIAFVLGLQRPDGAIRWNTGTDEALLTGSSSIFHAVRCALALARALGRDNPDWEWAAADLGDAVAAHPERFSPKDRYSMDWYYPVLGTVLRGDAAHERIDASWSRFVVPGLGVRCVDDHPWVTGGETCELALALASVGREAEARTLLTDIQHLRNPQDGLYWTGYVYADTAIWPEELTSWTAGSMLLALAALGGDPATAAVFGGAGLPAVRPAEVKV